MAKVTIAGNSYVITSGVSMADLETVKKYRPSALAITDPETKETLFKVGMVCSLGVTNFVNFVKGDGIKKFIQIDAFKFVLDAF